MIICLEVPEIGEALKKILRNPEYQEELGKAGRKYVRRTFGIEAATKKTVEVYRKVLKK